MEAISPLNTKVSKSEVSTIKLSKTTKTRLDNLKLYPRETYEEIMQRVLEILNLAHSNPERARARLVILDKQRRRNFRGGFDKSDEIEEEKSLQVKSQIQVSKSSTPQHISQKLIKQIRK